MDPDIAKLLESKYALALAGRLVPERLAIETTNYCNARCVMCPRRGLTRPKGHMALDQHAELLQRFASWRSSIVSISHAGIGEPLMDPSIDQKISNEKQWFTNAKIHLYSNGSLLEGDICERLLSCGLDSVSVSINAYYKDSYERIMGLDHDRTLRNVLRFIELRNHSGRHLNVNVSIIPQDGLRSNEISAFQEFWTPLADQVCVPPYVSWGDTFQLPATTRDYSLAPCQYLWDVFLVDHTGVVKLCCEDFNTRHPIGDIYSQSPAEIFNSTTMNRLRRQHLDGDFTFDICRHCLESGQAAVDFWKSKLAARR